MNEIANIENSLEASTAKDNLLDIIGGTADYTLENILEMGDGIPIVSYLTKGIKATLAVRDYLFMEKVIEFLREVGKEPTASRQKMIDKIQEDSEYAQKFGKVSLVAIERFDDLDKARLLGQAVRYLARDEISFSMYKRVAHIISRLYSADIYKFTTTQHYELINLHFRTDLEALGLVISLYTMEPEFSYKIDADIEVLSHRVKITDLGLLFKCLVLQKPLSSQQTEGFTSLSFSDLIRQKYP